MRRVCRFRSTQQSKAWARPPPVPALFRVPPADVSAAQPARLTSWTHAPAPPVSVEMGPPAMNRIKITLTTALFLLFAAFTYAQEPSQEPKPPQHEQPASAPEPNREVAPPAQQPEVAPPAHPNEARSPRQQEEAKPPRQEKPEKPEAQQKPEGEKPPRDQNKPAHEQHGQQPQKGQQAQTGQRA